MLLLLVAACTKTEDAPLTLEQLTAASITDFYGDAETDHVADLVVWMDENAASETDGYAFATLDPAVVADIPHDTEEVDWSRCFGAGVLQAMQYTVGDYARVEGEEDQSFADPSYDSWTRTFTTGDAGALVGGDDATTDNDIVKTVFTYTLGYGAEKDFRWFGDDLAALTYIPSPGWDDGHDNGVIVGFTIEVWHDGADGMEWYNGQWTEIVTIADDFIDEEGAINLLIGGTQDYMDGTEDHITDEQSGG